MVWCVLFRWSAGARGGDASAVKGGVGIADSILTVVAPLSLAEIQTHAGDAIDTTAVYLARRREIENRVLAMIKAEVRPVCCVELVRRGSALVWCTLCGSCVSCGDYLSLFMGESVW